MGVVLAGILHALASTIWVGGLFFMLAVMRPASGGRMDPSARLPLWHRAFKYFLAWLWGCIVVLIATGYYLAATAPVDIADRGISLQLKHAVAWMMVLVLAYMTFVPYRRATLAVHAGDRLRTARQLYHLRVLAAVAFALGIAAVTIRGFQYYAS